MSKYFWEEIRTHYRLLTELLRLVDTYFSNFVLLSCSLNMYTICVQLYNSFQSDNVYLYLRKLSICLNDINTVFIGQPPILFQISIFGSLLSSM